MTRTGDAFRPEGRALDRPLRFRSTPLMAKPPPKKPAAKAATKDEPVLLSGGNPQIAKGYGEAPIKAYIAAAPGWKGDLSKRLDALITKTVPGVLKAVKWNSPMYGVEQDHYFVSFHCMTKYVKVAFHRGAALKPSPPGASKQKNVRYLDIYEEGFDEAQFTAWVKQASKLPGEKM